MKNRLEYILTLIFFLVCLSSKAVNINNGTMNNITISEGLAGMSVSNMVTDCNGQVWIATSNGVSMFNGKRVFSYAFPMKDLSLCYCFNVAFDSQGTLYAATRGGLFALQQGNFIRVSPYSDLVEDVLPVRNNIYFATHHGLYVYSKHHEMKRIVVSSSVDMDNSVRCIRMSRDSAIWFTARYTLNRYNPSTKSLKRIRIPLQSGLSSFCICGNKIFIGSKNNGLVVYDLRSKRLRTISLGCNVITSVKNVDENFVCVSSDGGGAFLIDAVTERIKLRYGADEQGIYHLPDNAVYCYYRDANGIDWFGLYRKGLCYRLHEGDIFKYYHCGSFTSRGLDVKSYFVDGSVKLIGASTGLYYIDEVKKSVNFFSSKEMGTNSITCINKYHGLYYIGTYDSGLLTFDPHTMSFRRPSKNPKLKFSTFVSMTVDPDKRFWATSSEGLFIFEEKGNVKNITEKNADIYGGVMDNVLFDSRGNGWMGSMDGVCYYNRVSRKFSKDKFPKGFFNKITDLSFLKGHDDLIFAYGGKNIFFTDHHMIHYGRFMLPKGVLEEKCSGMMDDNDGYYWIVTEKGLFRINYSLDGVQHFGSGEGLNSMFLSKPWSDQYGNVWLAASDGLMIINSKDLQKWKNNVRYKVIPYKISIDGYPIASYLENEIVDRKHISIRWNLLSQNMQFVPILEDYAIPDGRLYEYRIDNDKWILSKDGDEISVSSLFVGVHKLSMRLAGAPGTETDYYVTVSPSALFYIEILFIVATVWFFVWWFQSRKRTKALLEERNTIEQSLIEEEHERQMLEMAKDNILVLDESNNMDEKYRNVKLDPHDADDIINRMNDYMESHLPYLNQNLRISDLASVLNVSQAILSMVFAIRLKQSYYDYVNAYRLNEFKKMLKNGDHKRYKLTSLSEKCGFKRTSFFTTFRKMEGMTPTEYIQKMMN